jgi:uncharacterized repeat protein (TIGR03803 family)
MAGLVRDTAGNLYGTTVEGGETTCFSQGCGIVFKLDATGKEIVLHRYSGSPDDGEMPEALLVEDGVGNLYGTTFLGGASGGYGTVFRISEANKEDILHSFAGPPDGGDGAYSYAGVIRDSAGNLYGDTFEGGAFCCGVVYKIDTTGSETLLYSFTGESDGGGPSSVLLADAAGNLFGTTQEGGNLTCGGGDGCGVVFELSAQSDGGWAERVLYVFCSLTNCSDGEYPGPGPLVLDSDGNLYGTTFSGGKYNNGIVYKVDTTGKESVLHDFSGKKDGGTPAAGLSMDKFANLYGATELGGDSDCTITSDGCGVVFKLTP